MCLITRQKESKILKKDLTVFKFVKEFENNSCMSHVGSYGFIYRKDILNKTTMKRSIDFSPFDDVVERNYPCCPEYNDDLISIGEGFHSSLRKSRLSDILESYFLKPGTIIAEFVIPKGSEVYEDATGLIVSNQIIFKKI